MKKILPYLIDTLAFLLLVGLLFAVNTLITPHLSGGESFRVPWMGARSLLVDQVNPYTSDVANQAQIEVYGRPAQEGEYPYRLDIPLYLFYFYMPFALIENFDLARALWMSFAEIALFAVGLLSINLTDWKASRINLGFFFLVLLFSFFGLYPLLDGSGAIFTALVLFFSLVVFREEQDEFLGIIFLFGTLNLQHGGVLLLFIVFLLITSKRWKAFSVFGMSLIVILALTLILIPGWILPFLSSLRANLTVGQGLYFSEMFQIWLPDNSLLIANIIKWGFLLILFFEWRAVRGRGFQHILWVASLSIAMVPFIGVRTTPALFTFLFLPIVLLFKIAQDRWKYANWTIFISLVLILASWFFFSKSPHALEILTYALPAALILTLYWMRWWLVRPPRTWADEIK